VGVLRVAIVDMMCGFLAQVLTFTSSLFGDLIESIMKRDAGLKVRRTSDAWC
jgi:CDP-diglyceride synthetase